LGKRGCNASHTPCINAHTSEGKTDLELNARRSLLRLYRFLKKHDGFENLSIDSFAPECGVRESVIIKGKKTVTTEDYTSGKCWCDALCYSFYPIDLHSENGSGLIKIKIKQGVFPSIPRGAMLPLGSQNLIVAGRSVSSERLANSALRTQASCMGMGQAAGAMAVLSVQTKVDPEALEMEEIHSLLRRHDAVTPRLTAS